MLLPELGVVRPAFRLLLLQNGADIRLFLRNLLPFTIAAAIAL